MKQSKRITKISKSIVGFQKDVGKIKKDAKNPFFKSNYATLSNILDVIQEPLTKNGLAIMQFPTDENGLTTRLIHESGQFIEATYFMDIVDKSPQKMGSAITYQRRYALGAILSLNIDDDDDGNEASNSKPSKTKEEKPWLNKDTPQWKNAIKHLSGDGDISEIKEIYKISKENEKELNNSI